MMKNNEINLEKLRAGDEFTWRMLFEKHYHVMCYYASQILNDDFLAKAVTSDVMAHLWEKRHGIQISSSLRSYLLQATRNKCLDYLKSNNVKRTNYISDYPDVDIISLFSTHPEDLPVSILLERELEGKLAEAIAKLPEDCRVVFEKSRFEGQKYHEIAEDLGISINTVKYHIKRALSILRAQLEKFMLFVVALFILC